MKTIVTAIPSLRTFYKGQRTLEIGYPWLTFGAIMALEKILIDSKGTFKILEMGSGGSTLFFESRCRDLLSLEDDSEWAGTVLLHIKTQKTVLECRRLSALLRIVKKQSDESFDLVLADSASGGHTYIRRQRLMDAAIPKVKKGGWLVIDNYEHLKFDPKGWDVYTFDMFHYSGRGTKLCKKL